MNSRSAISTCCLICSSEGRYRDASSTLMFLYVAGAHFCTKLVQFFPHAASGIKLVPTLHVPEVPCREALGVRELALQIEAHLLDDARPSAFLGFSHNQVSAELPVEQI